MLYTGLDIHKRYSVACTFDGQGRKIREGRISGNSPEAFAAYFGALPEPSEVLLEACWNWGTVHDTLEESAAVAAVLVSHPAKNRIIADAQIKTDKVATRRRWGRCCEGVFSRKCMCPRAACGRRRTCCVDASGWHDCAQ